MKTLPADIMKKVIIVIFAILLALLAVIPCITTGANAEEIGNEETAPIEFRWVNSVSGAPIAVREAPDAKAKIVKRLKPGTKVLLDTTVTDTVKDWTLIIVNSQVDGWVRSDLLFKAKPTKYQMTEDETGFTEVEEAFEVTALPVKGHPGRSVGLRVTPTKNAKAIRTLQEGDILTVLAEGTVFSKVLDTVTGRIGFVANDYIARV